MAKYEVVQTQFIQASGLDKVLWLYEEERKDLHIFEVYEVVGTERKRIYKDDT